MPDNTTPERTTPNTTTPGTVRRPSTANTAGDKAREIARDIAKEKNIESASCVVTGDTALVGLQFEEQYKGKVTDAIKRSVEKRVKKIEPSIKKVAVTADPDLLSRIKTMAKDIEDGKPLSGFTKEIEEIIRRINPF
jgi:YhcN/YlaJ family sporulation lipoprotein